jgi:HD-GYP domain-containing protein (c-di-GMP phosphodiesterase class II)
MGDADARLLEMIAAHVGTAVAAAQRHEALERILVRAGAALTAAEGDDDARTAVAVGRRLGLGDAALRDLALAALMADEGVATPIDEHAVTLRDEPPTTLPDALAMLVPDEPPPAPTDPLEGARTLRVHAREHWDGTGPAGLAGDAIPLGARVLAACAARANGAALVRGSGTRFDPAVVEALIATTQP